MSFCQLSASKQTQSPPHERTCSSWQRALTAAPAMWIACADTRAYIYRCITSVYRVRIHTRCAHLCHATFTQGAGGVEGGGDGWVGWVLTCDQHMMCFSFLESHHQKFNSMELSSEHTTGHLHHHHTQCHTTRTHTHTHTHTHFDM